VAGVGSGGANWRLDDVVSMVGGGRVGAIARGGGVVHPGTNRTTTAQFGRGVANNGRRRI